MVKGPNVMMGYYNNPEATKRVINSEGWLDTGDIGKIVHGRFLQITDRKKDIFKTSLGKYVAPQKVESIYLESAFIEHLMIVGFQKPYLTAIIYPNPDGLQHYAQQSGIHWTSLQYMVLNIKIKEKIQSEINVLLKRLPKHEHIRKFHLTSTPFTIEEGLLSNTLKTIRKNVVAKYSKEIEEMYK